jgi:hypothetical protein
VFTVEKGLVLGKIREEDTNITIKKENRRL